MNFKNILLLLVIFNCSSLQAQKPTDPEEFMKAYSDYFQLNSETAFLQLNKTTLIPKEKLYFSAYLYYGEFQEPSRNTRNLNIIAYNSKGEPLDAEIIPINEGSGSGYFDLEPKKFPPGTYFLKAETAYMKNFREDLSFLQSFTILGDSLNEIIEVQYDLQLLPEGGHLVANVHNNVGVKLINNAGKGVRFLEGKLIEEGKEIKLFKSNRFGLAEFDFIPKKGKDYKVLITPEYGEDIVQSLPTAQSTGLVLSAGRTSFNQFIFSIKTNKETYPIIKKDTFLIAIHQDGAIKTKIFTIPEESLEAELIFPKAVFFPGTNIITIFNQNFEPILERLVFNRDGIIRREINAEYSGKKLDSLQINLKSEKPVKAHSLSISVLPAETKSYNPTHNIFSAFYIQPFIKGNIENGAYYFSSDVNIHRRNKDLDLLLMTQGWSKYSWNNIFNRPPKEYYIHEAGFTIRGRVNGKFDYETEEIVIKSPETNIFEFVPIQNDGSFRIENIFLKDSSEISFGLINQKSGDISTPPVYFEVNPVIEPLPIKPPPFTGIVVKSNSNDKNVIIPESFLRGAEALDTIFLEAEIFEEEGKSLYLTENSQAERTIIDERMEDAFLYITDFIRFKGYRVFRSQGNLQIYSRRARLQMIDAVNGPTPAIYIDELRINDFGRLINLRTSEVESIVVIKSGASYGFGGTGGLIKIETKKAGDNPEKITASSVPKRYTSSGYSTTKEFYVPKYNSYSGELFESYGVIDWFSSVSLENGETNINIFNTLQPKVKLYIEGMTETGALISEEIVVEIK